MRIGGSVVPPYNSPEEWISHVKTLNYSAVMSPVSAGASGEEIRAYRESAEKHGLIIGEVGIWKNTLSPNENERKKAMAYAKEQLALAEELNANCAVNITGARGEVWDGCYAENYSKDAYALIIDSVREIIDSVKPSRTFYTLEPMPWMRPDSPEGYLELIKDVERPAFAVHLDYCNMINSVDKYINSSDFIKRCFDLLGPYIKSIHAKDVIIKHNTLPCHIQEVPPGHGSVDFGLVLRLTQKLGNDTTLFAEHLETHEQYLDASGYIRAQAEKAGVPVVSVF